jgi:hypothetical protein
MKAQAQSATYGLYAAPIEVNEKRSFIQITIKEAFCCFIPINETD